MGKTVITFGTYDLFHYGHLRIIQRARQLGDRLVVGVSSDALNYSKKAEYPAVSQEHRMAVVKAINGVDEVFLEESLETPTTKRSPNSLARWMMRRWP